MDPNIENFIIEAKHNVLGLVDKLMFISEYQCSIAPNILVQNTLLKQHVSVQFFKLFGMIEHLIFR